MKRKPLLVGEVNPYGADPYFALYPKPEGAAGARLCHLVLGFKWAHDYLEHTDRMNLCVGRWSLPDARGAALAVLCGDPGGPEARPIVLLGAKVCSAFGVVFRPFEAISPPPELGPGFLVLPHPSGRNRAWNDPGAYARARDAFASYLGRYE